MTTLTILRHLKVMHIRDHLGIMTWGGDISFGQNPEMGRGGGGAHIWPKRREGPSSFF